MIDKALTAAYTARAEARKALSAAAATLDRAQRFATTAADKVRNLEARMAAAEVSEATILAAAIAAGGPTCEAPGPIAFVFVDDLSDLRKERAVAAAALARLASAHASALATLAATETAVVAAVDEILLEENIARAAAVAHHLDEAARLGLALLTLTIASELHGRTAQPPAVTEVLQRLDLPLIDRRSIAINLIKDGDRVAAAARAERRAALIAGEVELVDEPVAA